MLRKYFLLFVILSFVRVQASEEDLVAADPNYIYAAVLGTGFYRVEDATLTTVRLPFTYTLKEESLEQAGWKVLLPVVLGYASLDPDDLIDKWIPTSLGTLSFIPGIEYRYQLNEELLLKPFAQVGGGYDFENGIWSGLMVAGGRGLWTRSLDSLWRVQLGSSLQWAGGWQEGGAQYSSFGLFELGGDLRRNLPWKLCQRQMNGSIYCRWRQFINEWNLAESPNDPINVDALYEIGVSLGVDRGFDLYGYDLHRVSIGYIWGRDTQAVSFGLSFPF